MYCSDDDAEMALELCYALGKSTNVVPHCYKGAPKDASKGAIYIGRLDNDLSSKAYKKLDQILEEKSFEEKDDDVYVGYLVYFDYEKAWDKVISNSLHTRISVSKLARFLPISIRLINPGVSSTFLASSLE